MGGHRDLLLHNAGEGQDRVVGIDLEELLHYLGIGKLMAPFVGRDGATYLGQLLVPVLPGVPCSVAVRYEGCPLLERRVNEKLIGIGLGFWILQVRRAHHSTSKCMYMLPNRGSFPIRDIL